jgi:tRNA U34 2-thiouridine synthase MnmA/TrmU
MATEIIQIRKKKNHNVTRSIKVSSLKSFSKFGWEIVPNQETKIVTAKKKVVAEPAGSDYATVQVSGAEITDMEGAELSETVTGSETGFVTVTEEEATTESPATGEQSTLEALRDEYQTITGKPADKRWSVKRISEEIEKLK